MRSLTVLGATGGYPQAGQACSGFLLKWDGYQVVLDLGYATLPRLLLHTTLEEVNAIVITHEHPDHCIDLQGLSRIERFAVHRPRPLPLPLFCTTGVLQRLSAIEPGVDLHRIFQTHFLPGTYELGPFTLTSVPLPHYVPSCGVRLETATHAIAYTGDTGPTSLLAQLGRTADLYIMDATDLPVEEGGRDGKLLTAAEAGHWATQAGARRLLLTHLWPGTDPAVSVEAAAEFFSGEILAAEQDLTIHL
jgi:ribonuclease BN (tRNA processing enzyme)